MESNGKIFGIGLGRTGTLSLNKALCLLGFNSIHNSIPAIKAMREGVFNFDGNWDALTNLGEWMFPQLDKEYPNSKFILTVRDKEAWLKSSAGFNGDSLDVLVTGIDIYGCGVFNRERFSYVYDLHRRVVEDYFKNRNDLLVIDICSGEGWEKLCSFLDVKIPDSIFPHAHRRELRPEYKQTKQSCRIAGDDK